MTMSNPVKTVVIVGGGTAGWLTAGVLAAEHRESDLKVLLIESPDVGPIGVGEGTWPTMRLSLEKMGISETDFIRQCDASFKQGTRFAGWLHGQDEFYYHPFTPPQGFNHINLARYWQPLREGFFRRCGQSAKPGLRAQPGAEADRNAGVCQ